MSGSLRHDLAAVIGENRWARERVAGLTSPQRALYASVLGSFADGRVPDAAVIAGRRDALAGLVARDLVGVEGEGAVVVAYPFSARPTRQRVHTEDGRRHYAMCAIDAFGIPYLLGQRVWIHAREPGSEAPIAVTVDPATDAVMSDPLEATVAAARSGSGRVASCACPHINLFSSRADAERYLSAPGLRGVLLGVDEAAAAGRALFAGLRELLAGQAGAPRLEVGSGPVVGVRSR